jgi:hypothetical protein
MRRADGQRSLAVIGSRGAESALPHHRYANLVITAVAGAAAIFLATAGRWAPGALESAAVFGLFALGPLVLWGLRALWPRSRPLLVAEAFWLLPVVAFGHGYLGPLVDAFDSRLMDRTLALLDLRLFGDAPSRVLGHLAPPWLTEILLFCYYSYFVWPAALGVVLWAQGKRAEFGQYTFALSVFFTVNYLGYVLVPAVGPRFYLAHLFPAPLEGVHFASLLDGLMRMPPFLRDCFPSGHTGATLTVLAFAWRFERRFFRVMVVPGTGLILATLVGRFHYGIDLMCAVPLVLATLSLAVSVVRLEAQQALVPNRQRVPALGRRQQTA